MKKYSFIVLLAIVFSNLYAQEETGKEDNPISISCELMSRYVWRGSDFGASPGIQPGIEYGKSGFTAGACGAYAVKFQGYQESDLYLGYTFYKEMFTVLITDYYFQNDLVNQNYFDYKKETTGHVFEVSLTFNRTEKFPLSVMIATNVYGADAKKINDDGTTGKNQFSTYAELTYSFKYFDAFIGANLTQVDVDKGETGYYGNYSGVVNMGITATKKIKITKDYKLPLTLSIITNPQAEKIYFVAGFSF